MRFGRSSLTVAMALWAGFAAANELGPGVAAAPEDLIVFSDQIRMGARVIFDKGEALAQEVTKPDLLRLEVGFMTDGKAGDQPVRLRCEVRFAAPDGERGEVHEDSICYEGNLADTAGKWTLTGLKFQFRPQVTDQNGASGVEVRVTDELSGDRAVLMPTYGWMGGQE